ncbi:hypothetical protein D3C79_890510 [compost metagenome]
MSPYVPVTKHVIIISEKDGVRSYAIQFSYDQSPLPAADEICSKLSHESVLELILKLQLAAGVAVHDQQTPPAGIH